MNIPNKITTWKKELERAFEETGEGINQITTTLTKEELTESFDKNWGSVNGKPFTAWGPRYVYFPIKYDGYESVGWAPRNPCNEPTNHWGGHTNE